MAAVIMKYMPALIVADNVWE